MVRANFNVGDALILMKTCLLRQSLFNKRSFKAIFKISYQYERLWNGLTLGSWSKKQRVFLNHVYCDRDANINTLSDKIAQQTACSLLDRSIFCQTVGWVMGESECMNTVVVHELCKIGLVINYSWTIHAFKDMNSSCPEREVKMRQ